MCVGNSGGDFRGQINLYSEDGVYTPIEGTITLPAGYIWNLIGDVYIPNY